jgi:hypothetical protein
VSSYRPAIGSIDFLNETDRADEKLTAFWNSNRRFAIAVAEIPATLRAYENNSPFNSYNRFTLLVCHLA